MSHAYNPIISVPRISNSPTKYNIRKTSFHLGCASHYNITHLNTLYSIPSVNSHQEKKHTHTYTHYTAIPLQKYEKKIKRMKLSYHSILYNIQDNMNWIFSHEPKIHMRRDWCGGEHEIYLLIFILHIRTPTKFPL